MKSQNHHIMYISTLLKRDPSNTKNHIEKQCQNIEKNSIFARFDVFPIETFNWWWPQDCFWHKFDFLLIIVLSMLPYFNLKLFFLQGHPMQTWFFEIATAELRQWNLWKYKVHFCHSNNYRDMTFLPVKNIFTKEKTPCTSKE